MPNLESLAPIRGSALTGGLASSRRPDAPEPMSQRPSSAARRTGYVIAAVMNGAMWYLVNVHPTWHAVPILTADTRLVLPWFNLSWFVTLAVNVLYVAHDPRWLVAAGNVLTTALGLVALISLMAVFPFDFPTQAWTTAAHVLLVIAIIGTAVGLFVFLIKLIAMLFVVSNTRRL
jgi:hypothetical protein